MKRAIPWRQWQAAVGYRWLHADTPFIGGEEPGLSGGRAKGKKSLVAVAVEVHEPRGYGRVRMGIIADASAACLHPFITANVEPGGTVITDGWQGYSGIERFGYTRDRRSQRAARARGEDPGELLPGVHRVASLAKRWLLGTHQGSVDEAHLQSYLDEFTFRFNRRSSRRRGLLFYRLLQQAILTDPIKLQRILRNLAASHLLPAGQYAYWTGQKQVRVEISRATIESPLQYGNCFLRSPS
jgi:transposase-like protein